MPRRTHTKPEEAKEDINYRLTIFLPENMRRFYELEAKQYGEKIGKRVTVSDMIRALATKYYEKKMAGLICDIHD